MHRIYTPVSDQNVQNILDQYDMAQCSKFVSAEIANTNPKEQPQLPLQQDFQNAYIKRIAEFIISKNDNKFKVAKVIDNLCFNFNLKQLRSLLRFIENYHDGKDYSFVLDYIKEKIHNTALLVIQQFCLQGILAAKLTFKGAHDTYVRLLPIDQDDEISKIAATMFGRAVANPNYLVRNPYANSIDYCYHRTDYKNDLIGPPAHYFPIHASSIELAKYVCTNFLNKKINWNITACHSIAVLPNVGMEQHSLQEAGLTSTMWENAICYATGSMPSSVTQMERNYEQYALQLLHNKDKTKPLYPLLQFYPKTLQQLKASFLMKHLKEIANDQNKPAYLLAKALYSMINKIPELRFDHAHQIEGIIQRIAAFLSIAINFGENTYNKFAFGIYGIIHEISLLLYIAIKNGQQVITYDDFMANAKSQASYIFGLTETDLQNITLSSTPRLGGAHAFVTCLWFVKEMYKTFGVDNPSVEIIDSIYYEFKDWLANFPKANAQQPADIYIISAGPIVQKTCGIQHGVDINKFILQRISDIKRRAIETNSPVHILVDATTALDKNLQLAQPIKELIETGIIVIVLFRSCQKFGLLHSDQAQYGEIFVLCNKNHSSALRNLNIEFESQKDFANSVDLQIGAYIGTCCGEELLEKIKLRHFANGALLNRGFSKIDLKTDPICPPKIYSNDGLNELYFIYMSRTFANIPFRDAFGHFMCTYANIGNRKRISAGASDKIDYLILLMLIKYEENYNLDSFNFLFDFAKLISQNFDQKSVQDPHKILQGLLQQITENCSQNQLSLANAVILYALIGAKSIIRYEEKVGYYGNSDSDKEIKKQKLNHYQLHLLLCLHGILSCNIPGLIGRDIHKIMMSTYFDLLSEIDKNPELIYTIQSCISRLPNFNLEGTKYFDPQKFKNLAGADFSGLNLCRRNFNDCSLIGANFVGRDLIGAFFDRADLRGVRGFNPKGVKSLSGANLSGLDLRDCDFSNCDLTGANLEGANLSWRFGSNPVSAIFDHADLRGVRGFNPKGVKSLRGADLSGLDLHDCDFTGCDLSGANLEGTNLTGAIFDRADLRGVRDFNPKGVESLEGADFSGLDLRDCDFSGHDLRFTNWRGANLTGAIFDNADLGCARDFNPKGVKSLRGADLSGLDLSNCGFTGCDLTGACFKGTNLTRAKFVGAILNQTDFRGAELQYADFSGANLENVLFDEVNLTSAKGITYDPSYKWTNIKVADRKYTLADEGSKTEFAKYVSELALRQESASVVSWMTKSAYSIFSKLTQSAPYTEVSAYNGQVQRNRS